MRLDNRRHAERELGCRKRNDLRMAPRRVCDTRLVDGENVSPDEARFAPRMDDPARPMDQFTELLSGGLSGCETLRVPAPCIDEDRAEVVHVLSRSGR